MHKSNCRRCTRVVDAEEPVVHDRLSLSKDGTKVIYKLKRKYRDGSTHVVLDPLDFIARLAALVPRPRIHLTTYHGVFAPASSFRDHVVPAAPDNQPTPKPCHHVDPEQVGTQPDAEPPKRRRRYSWAELMQRVFRIDVLVCPHCSGMRRVLEFLTNAAAIERILTHLGLPITAPAIAPARPPPDARLPFDV